MPRSAARPAARGDPRRGREDLAGRPRMTDAFASAVLLAAGSSTRMGLSADGRRKPCLELAGRTLVEHALATFCRAPSVAEVVLVAHGEDLAAARAALEAWPEGAERRACVPGGAERTDSVRLGFAATSAACEVVLVHDVARPLVRVDQVEAVAAAAREHGGALLAVPVRDTIKLAAEGRSVSTLDRASPWAAQTPQALRRAELARALAEAEEMGLGATDDAALYERHVGQPLLVEGSPENLKLTVPGDMALAEAILAFRERADAELAGLDGSDARMRKLEAEGEAEARRVAAAAEALSRGRREAAGRLAEAVGAECAGLALEGARFEVALEPASPAEGAPCGPHGAETPEFRFSANPGEALQPLRRVASGGELSRVFLALKNVLRREGAGMVLVFDEVDAGIGGGVAERVGALLASLAASHQVLCITHLPQIAVHGARHFRVAKQGKGGRTVTRVEPLDEEARVEEIARMAGGARVKEATRRHARELLDAARRAAGPRKTP